MGTEKSEDIRSKLEGLLEMDEEELIKRMTTEGTEENKVFNKGLEGALDGMLEMYRYYGMYVLYESRSRPLEELLDFDSFVKEVLTQRLSMTYLTKMRGYCHEHLSKMAMEILTGRGPIGAELMECAKKDWEKRRKEKEEEGQGSP